MNVKKPEEDLFFSFCYPFVEVSGKTGKGKARVFVYLI